MNDTKITREQELAIWDRMSSSRDLDEDMAIVNDAVNLQRSLIIAALFDTARDYDTVGSSHGDTLRAFAKRLQDDSQ